ncbi:MAG TPA: glycerophosphodiester phosphodiesterase [Terriglobales bacterium]|nr:glycerophosphodiester phosphodiesterase [Terriglobales bacterium]
MSDRPLLLGHRGARASTSIPENTPASFDFALEHGCDGFEFDVRLAGGGCCVVCHDPTVDGITVSRADANQLTHLPLLDDVLQRYAQRAFLDIELKVAGLESKILNSLREYRMEQDYVVSSFLPEVVMELKTRSQKIQAGIICDKPEQLACWRETNAEYAIPHHSLVTLKLVKEVHDAGRKLLTWTVNDQKQMLRLADWGVDGIISDDSQLLVKTFT